MGKVNAVFDRVLVVPEVVTVCCCKFALREVGNVDKSSRMIYTDCVCVEALLGLLDAGTSELPKYWPVPMAMDLTPWALEITGAVVMG